MYYVYKLNCRDGVYVGMTSNLKERLRHHKKVSGMSNHPYETYEVIAYTCSYETACLIEDLAIRKFGSLNRKTSGLYRTTDEYAYLKKLKKENLEFAERQLEASRKSHSNMREGELMMFGRTSCYLFRRMFKC